MKIITQLNQNHPQDLNIDVVFKNGYHTSSHEFKSIGTIPILIKFELECFEEGNEINIIILEPIIFGDEPELPNEEEFELIRGYVEGVVGGKMNKTSNCSCNVLDTYNEGCKEYPIVSMMVNYCKKTKRVYDENGNYLGQGKLKGKVLEIIK